MFKYNEEAYAEHILETGFGTKHINQELGVLAKYYKQQGVKDVKEALCNFCEKNLAGFNKVKYYKNINAAVKKAVDKDENLIVINEIPVTDAEIERINSYSIEYIDKKILFTMMVLEKLNKQYYHLSTGKDINDEHFFGGTTKNYKELVESSGIPYSKRNKSKHIHEIIHRLHELDIVEIKNKGSVKLNYLYSISFGDTLLRIKNFDRIGLYYDMHCKVNKIIPCGSCEEPIKKVNNRVKYCKACWEDKQKEWQRNSMKKSRKKICEVLEKPQNH